MSQKLISLALMLVFILPLVKFCFAEDEPKKPMPAEIMQKQIADALKLYGEKKEQYRKDVLELFERKENFSRNKGDLKTLNLIKNEKDAFLENGKEPTLFFITDQKRSLELAKLDLIKAYEKVIKDCLKMKLDMQANGFLKELEEIKTGKTKSEMKAEEKRAKRIFLEAPFGKEEAKAAQIELAKNMGKLVEAKIDLGKNVKLEMILIPPGKFIMGDPGKDHNVTLTKSYYMSKYEVTQDQWQALMGNNPSSVKGVRLPVTNVSWIDCQDFIRKLNTNSNGRYRLPTEAEWEYACRAGTTTNYSYGDSITRNDANYDSPTSKTVGSYKANAFGLYDMHGNVWEWCNDWYGDYPNGPSEDPKGPLIGQNRVLRSGSFGDIGINVRSSIRRSDSLPHLQSVHFGFRLVAIN